MIVLGLSDSLNAGSTSAATVNCTVMGAQTDNTTPPINQKFDALYQGQLSNAVAALITNTATQALLISSVHLFNTGGTQQTVTVAVNGNASSNSIATIVLPANGWATYEDGDGWTVYSSTGVVVTGQVLLGVGLGTPATATQSLTASSANVLTGTSFQIGTNTLQVGNRFRFTFTLGKTAAGVATWIAAVKFGTAGTTADGAIASFTSGTNTAAVDKGMYILDVWITAVGSGTSATCNAAVNGFNRLTDATGLGVLGPGPTSTTGFDSTLASPFIHVDVTPGASAVMTAYGAAAEKMN
jgi:hypothetical protein